MKRPCDRTSGALADFFDSHLIHHHVDDRAIAGLGCFCLSDFPYDIQSFGYFSKHRMSSVEVRGRSKSDEELATVGVWTGVRHREDSFGVVLELGMDFIGECITGAAAACACRVAALDHESIDHAVKDDSVVEVFFCELDEIRNSVGRLLLEELNGEVSQGRFKMCVGTGGHFSIVAFLM